MLVKYLWKGSKELYGISYLHTFHLLYDLIHQAFGHFLFDQHFYVWFSRTLSTDIAKRFILAGASPSRRTRILFFQKSYSPLHIACFKDNLQFIPHIDSFKSNLWFIPHFFFVIYQDPVSTELAKRLILAGASPSRRTRISFFQKTYSPLHITCFKGNIRW